MSTDTHDQLTITNDVRHLAAVRNFVGRMVRLSPLKGEAENRLILAVDEAVANIIQHGYEGGGSGTIEIDVRIGADRLTIVIRDSGRSFDPGKVPLPDIATHVRSGKSRGLGIFLMRQAVDELHYLFSEGVRNELTLIKYFH